MRYKLTESEWQIIQPILPNKPRPRFGGNFLDYVASCLQFPHECCYTKLARRVIASFLDSMIKAVTKDVAEMTIRNVFAPLTAPTATNSCLDTALLLAKNWRAHAEILYVRQSTQSVLRAAALAEAAFAEQELAKSFEREQSDGEKLARQKFDDLVVQHRIDCRESARPSELPSAYFRTVEGDVAEEIEKRGAAYDLIVVARPQDKLASQPVVEAALFNTGCPVFVAPPSPPKVVGEHVMIGWNQSVPSARAVRCAMPFLETAAQVEIFSIATGAKKGASAQDIARFLSSHNVEARLIIASPDRRTVGETILSKASELGVDLLVLGAFSQGRIRQLILGGVTDHVLKHANLPMLMAH